jgi:hypothetical protein
MWMRGLLVLGVLVCALVPSASAATHSPTLYTHFGLSVALPPGWRPVVRRLTPCIDPAERLTVAGRGGLVMLQERMHPASGEFPARPLRFALRGRPHPMECCAPSSRPGWWERFAENGRGFYVYVYLGRNGPRKEALAILDSLRVRPRDDGV